jgi:monoamine oxidase
MNMSSDRNEDQPDLGRRRFVHQAGAGALATGAAGLIAAGSGVQAGERGASVCKTPGCDYDVVVIGGGFAGVAAARDCSENGYSTLLVEARNRLGGRTFSSEFEGHPVELGGTWIHWTQPFVWAEKERYGLEVLQTPGAVPDRMILFMDGKTRTLTEAELHSMGEAYAAYTADSRELMERPYDYVHTWDKLIAIDNLSGQDRLDQLDLTPLQRLGLESLIASCAHNSADQMSYVEVLRWFSLAGFNDMLMWFDAVARYKLKDGTIGLINAMLDDGKAEVRLSTPVKSVEDQGGRVRITTTRGEQITAAAVVVTIPMNILPDVDFSPALDPELIEAAREMHTGQGLKVYAKVKGKVGKLFTLASQDHPLNTVFTYYEGSDHTLLVGFGSDRNKIDIYDEESVQTALRDFIPGVEVESTFGYDWVLDPYSRGTYASYKPGWLGKYYAHFQQDRGRVFFGSGDHGEGGWRGFIDGAIGAGIKAAQRVHKTLG